MSVAIRPARPASALPQRRAASKEICQRRSASKEICQRVRTNVTNRLHESPLSKSGARSRSPSPHKRSPSPQERVSSKPSEGQMTARCRSRLQGPPSPDRKSSTGRACADKAERRGSRRPCDKPVLGRSKHRETKAPLEGKENVCHMRQLTDSALEKSQELLAGLYALGLSDDNHLNLLKEQDPYDHTVHEEAHNSGGSSVILSPAEWPELGHKHTDTVEVPRALLETFADSWALQHIYRMENTTQDDAAKEDKRFVDEGPSSSSSRSASLSLTADSRASTTHHSPAYRFRKCSGEASLPPSALIGDFNIEPRVSPAVALQSPPLASRCLDDTDSRASTAFQSPAYAYRKCIETKTVSSFQFRNDSAERKASPLVTTQSPSFASQCTTDEFYQRDGCQTSVSGSVSAPSAVNAEALRIMSKLFHTSCAAATEGPQQSAQMARSHLQPPPALPTRRETAPSPSPVSPKTPVARARSMRSMQSLAAVVTNKEEIMLESSPLSPVSTPVIRARNVRSAGQNYVQQSMTLSKTVHQTINMTNTFQINAVA